jgi:Ca2+-binding RTX toxin-like protein
LYGSKGNDIILSGAGNSLADGGPGDDVLTGGIGHSLLIGGPGNDKLFAGPGDTVMEGGSGANHFDCPVSIAGLGRSIVLDYNPSNGDTISGQCTLVGRSGVGGGEGAGAAATLPDSGETPSSSPSSGNNLAIEGVIAGRGSSR